MPNDIIQNRLQIFSPEYRSFLASGVIEEICLPLAETEGFSEDQKIVFQNGLALYLLFILDIDAFADFVSSECDMPADQARILVRAAHNMLPEEIMLALLKADTVPTPPTTTSLADDIEAAEAALNSIPKIRTMEQDMRHTENNEPIYSSSQDALLNNKNQTL